MEGSPFIKRKCLDPCACNRAHNPENRNLRLLFFLALFWCCSRCSQTSGPARTSERDRHGKGLAGQPCGSRLLKLSLAHEAGASKVARRGWGGELWVLFHLCCCHTGQSHHCLSCRIQCKGFLTDLPTSTLRRTKHAPHSSLHGLCEAPIRLRLPLPKTLRWLPNEPTELTGSIHAYISPFLCCSHLGLFRTSQSLSCLRLPHVLFPLLGRLFQQLLPDSASQLRELPLSSSQSPPGHWLIFLITLGTCEVTSLFIFCRSLFCDLSSLRVVFPVSNTEVATLAGVL